MAKTSNKLTSKDLKNLAVGQSAYGSNLRATRNKSGITFHASFTLDGERYQHKLGTDATMNLTDAIREAAQYRATKEREHELKHDGGAESEMTLNEAVPMYMDHLHHHDGKNIKAKEHHFRIHILPNLGSKVMARLNTLAVNEFRSSLRKNGLTTGTVNRVMATLNHFYRHAQEQSWIHSQPYVRSNYKENFKQRDRISRAEQKALLEAAQQPGQHPMLHLFLLIGFGTGMRHREILTIQWENIRWHQKRVHLPHTKTGEREQPLPQIALDALRALQEARGTDAGFVFAADTKTGHINDLSRQFKRLCKTAGLKAIYTPHYMRHTKVTELVEAGKPLDVIKQITGHETTAMISRYAHLAESKAVQLAVDEWDPYDEAA
ncbi:tyrosine-type recombinase/integrase [Nioella ostreopsis]|uniref:tyrosine-type recombinase/integrase n=1 Tax=Nioella ostreopsis TaxID=2448479 RepID=UPI000FD915AC|nr:site-specific integrase [Nioella ostreopsis]